MTDTGDHNANDFLNTWGELAPEERLWIFQTLITLQPRACVVHQGGCVLAANGLFGQYLKTNVCELLGCDLGQHVPAPMLDVALTRAYGENTQPYPFVARTGRALGLFDIEPHILHLDGHVMRLLFIKPLARLRRVRWLAKVGGGA